MNNENTHSSDYPTKERMIEIMKLMLKYITEGGVEAYWDPLVDKETYNLLIKGKIVGGFCSLLKDMVYLYKDITVLEEDVVLDHLKQELKRIRGTNSLIMIRSSYWYDPMCFSSSKDEVAKGRKYRVVFLEKCINKEESTNKLSNSI